MNIKVEKSKIEGKIDAPSSKSMTHRALILSSLAHGKSKISAPLESDDTQTTSKVLEQLGIEQVKEENWIIDGGTFREPECELFCGESGTTMRFMTAVSALVNGKCVLTGGPGLSKRPIGPLVDSLSKLGVDIKSTGGTPPVVVRGRGLIPGGETTLRGDISSQFISALLLISPLAEKQTVINISTRLESKPYVNMTMEAMKAFGVKPQRDEDYSSFTSPRESYKPTSFDVEGDWSSAAFLLAAGVLTGEVIAGNLNMDSPQADRQIINLLEKMGGNLEKGKNAVKASKSELKATRFDVRDCPDLFPIASVLCSTARGESILTGLKRLRIKESDRLKSMLTGLEGMGVETALEGDFLRIKGGKAVGSVIDPFDDHRIAMSFGVLGLVAEGKTIIKNSECVEKSYPEFWSHLESLGAEIGVYSNE